MFTTLLYLGLCVTAFAAVPGLDERDLKMAVALCFAIALGTAELFKTGIKPIRNKWAYILLAYVPISIYLAPCPTIDLVGIQVKNFWSWQPCFKIVSFMLMFLAIASHEFKKEEVNKILKIMLWVGTLMSLYHVVQFFNVDQFFDVKAYGEFGRVAGFLGHPIITGAFVAILVPIGIYFKDWPKTLIMLVGAVIPDSQTAWVALFLGIMFYLAMKSKKWLIWIIFSLFTALVLFVTAYEYSEKFASKFNDHERYAQWKQIAKDCAGPLDIDKGIKNKMAVTGRGIGAFRFVYRIEHPNLIPGTNQSENGYEQAHNEYLEMWYGMGLVGLIILLIGAFKIFQENWVNPSRYQKCLMTSLFISMLSAICVFIWQIGTTAFLTVVIAGLLSNRLKTLRGPNAISS